MILERVGVQQGAPTTLATSGKKYCRGCDSFKEIAGFFQRKECKRDGVRSVRSLCKSCTAARGHLNGVKREFGLTAAAYSGLLDRQGGGCAICGRKPDVLVRRLAVDHCHATGRIRGLLCGPCNLGLGKLGDTLEALERAVAYLRGQAA